MRLRQIEIFHAVYMNGSISTAARALNVSQPSVSKVLKHAEDQLGFRLFRRLKGRLIPTDEAHVLFREVQEVFARLDSFRTAARNLKTREGGHLRLAVLPALGLEAAPAAIARFRKTHPGVTFDVQTLHHEDVLRALYERKCDLAFAYEPAEHPRLTTLQVGSGELMLLFRNGEFSPDQKRIDLSSLENRPFIGSGASGPVSEIFAREVASRQLAVDEVISSGTFYMAASLVRFGAGVAVVDEFTARAVSVLEEVDFRPLDPPLTFGVYAIHLDDRPLSHLARSFLDVLKATMRETGGRA